MSSRPAVTEIADKPFTTYTRAQVDKMVDMGMRKKLGFARDPKPNLPTLPPLYIFNVSDKEVRWHQPGFDFYTVPACSSDAEYSDPCIISGLVQYEILEIDRTKWLIHNAEEVAQEILQIGAGKPPEQNLENFGLFRSWSNPPKPSEVAAAKKRFLGTLEAIVKDGNYIHSQGQKKGPDGLMIGSEHMWAANLLGQQTEWSKGARQMVPCPECQFDMPANASVHFGPGGCGAVIDAERAFASTLIDEKKYKQFMDAKKKKSESLQ